MGNVVITLILLASFLQNVRGKCFQLSTMVGEKYVSNIELTDEKSLPEGSITYYKHVLLLYCKVLATKYAEGEKSLGIFRNYRKLKQFDPSYYVYNHRLSSLLSLGRNLLFIINHLVEIAARFMRHKESRIEQRENFLRSAFYHRILQWLKYRMHHPKLSKKFEEHLHFFLDDISYSRNYWSELCRKDDIPEVLGYRDAKLSNFQALDEFGKLDDEIAYFIYDAVRNKKETDEDYKFEIERLTPGRYEYLLSKVDAKKFQKVVEMSTARALWNLDYALLVQQNRQNYSSDTYKYINLSELKLESISYYKYSMLLFVRALDLSEDETKIKKLHEFHILQNFSERDECLKLRYEALYDLTNILYFSIIQTVDRESLHEEEFFYYYRLFQWIQLRQQFHGEIEETKFTDSIAREIEYFGRPFKYSQLDISHVEPLEINTLEDIKRLMRDYKNQYKIHQTIVNRLQQEKQPSQTGTLPAFSDHTLATVNRIESEDQTKPPAEITSEHNSQSQSGIVKRALDVLCEYCIKKPINFVIGQF